MVLLLNWSEIWDFKFKTMNDGGMLNVKLFSPIDKLNLQIWFTYNSIIEVRNSCFTQSAFTTPKINLVKINKVDEKRLMEAKNSHQYDDILSTLNTQWSDRRKMKFNWACNPCIFTLHLSLYSTTRNFRRSLFIFNFIQFFLIFYHNKILFFSLIIVSGF